MSLAENLLMTLDNNPNPNLIDDDPHIIVLDTRQIVVPTKLKTIAVTNDKDIETITIDFIRYWDGHDFADFALYINYTLSNGDNGTYIPQNIVIGDKNITFTWTIEQFITKTAGNLSFSIEAIKTNDSGEVEYQWGSIPNSEMSIVKGIQRADIPEEGVGIDIISQVLQSANEAKKYADQVFELYGDINAFGSTVSSNTKRITNLEQGIPHELFVTDGDVSHIKYAPPRALPYAEINKFGGKVTEIRSGGANMVNSALASQSTTTNGITFTNNGDGSFTVNGEASAQATYYIHQIVKGNTLPLKSGVSYTLSGNAPKQVGLAVYDEKWKTNVSFSSTSNTFTISDDALKYGFYLYVPAGTKVENVTVYPMLNVGTEAAPFKSYKETVDTFIIPAEVQALDGYGEGNNYIDLDEQIFVSFGNNEPMETDISHLIGTDNFIRAEGGGTVTFVNAENLPISSEITYMLKEDGV